MTGLMKVWNAGTVMSDGIKCIAFVDTCVSGQVTAAVSVCLAGHECSGSTFYKGNI